MAFKILTGKFNFAARCGLGATYGAVYLASPPPLAGLTFDRIIDGALSPPFRCNAPTVSGYMRFDLNAWSNYGWESGLVAPWTAVTGVVATDQVHTGLSSLKNTSAGQVAYIDVVVQPGEQWKFIGWNRAGDTVANPYFRFRLMETGLDWDGAAWVTAGGAPTKLGLNAVATTWATYTTTVTIPAFSSLMKAQVTLRVSLEQDGAGSSWFDDIQMIPGVNFVGMFGHNLPARMTLRFDYFTSEALFGSGDTIFVLGGVQSAPGQSFYVQPALVFARSWQLFFVDALTNGWQPAIGEVVLGQAVDLLRDVDFPLRWAFKEPGQVRYPGGAGPTSVYNPGAGPIRTGVLNWTCTTAAQLQQLRDALMITSRGGGLPCILIPTGSDVDCLYGRITDPVGFDQSPGIRTCAFTFEEEPRPLLSGLDPVTGA